MKQRKWIASVLFFAVFVFALFPFGGQASPELPPEGWTGIYGREDLEKISLAPDGQYILMNDIDLTGAAWTPLCSEDLPFSGVLDGNSFSVYGMEVSVKNAVCGLFSFISGGEVKNLSVAGSAEGSVVGLLAGKAHNAIISDCFTQGSVSGTFCAGGLVGQISGESGSISYCVSDAFVSLVPPSGASKNAEFFLGGLVGAAYGTDLTFSGCQTMGTVSFSGTTVTAGGMVGLFDAGGLISECGTESALSLSVSKKACVGGLVGRLGSYGVTVRKSTFRSEWEIPSCDGYLDVGGIVGRIDALEPVVVEECIAYGMISSVADSASLGGIVGTSVAAEASVSVLRCTSFAHLSATGHPLYVGGICGINRGEGGLALIENCHGDGSVTHDIAPIEDPQVFFGGICAFNGGSGDSKISLCFSSCEMLITYVLVDGAVVGMSDAFTDEGTALVDRCYYRDGAREFFATAVSGEALSDPASYVGFDFETVWRIDESFALPLLRTDSEISDSLPAGDVDGNGLITPYDAQLLLQYLTDRTVLSDGQLHRADIDGNGLLDARDVSLILRNAI